MSRSFDTTLANSDAAVAAIKIQTRREGRAIIGGRPSSTGSPRVDRDVVPTVAGHATRRHIDGSSC